MRKVHIQSLVYTIIFILISASIFVIPTSITIASSTPTCILNAIVQPFNNGGTTLSWRVYNASTVRISGVGMVSANDSLVVYPQTTTVYTLTATGNGVRSCSVTVLPVSVYTFGTMGTAINTQVGNPSCQIWIRPDFVVTGGTGILSWNAGNALSVNITNGVGSVSNIDSKIIPNRGIPETYTMTARWGSGVVRTCSATLFPSTLLSINSTTHTYGGIPYVSQPQYIAISRVPYTGTNDIWYIALLLLISSSSFLSMYVMRKKLLILFFD